MPSSPPTSARELAEALAEAAAARRTIEIHGNRSKRRAGSAAPPADVCVSTSALDQVLEYEPRDLTCSVGAGMPYARFQEMLDRDGYMVPLDPSFAATATVGGAIASNSSGPRRRGYGTARDLVIGMQFATLEGKLVQSGGMVVKNVAGLDMGKLLIGSLGTLAAITVVNFKLMPAPAGSRTFLFEFADAGKALAFRDKLLAGVLQPVAIDLFNPAAASELGRNAWTLAVQGNGNAGVLERYRSDLGEGELLDAVAERMFWEKVREFTPGFLAENPEGVVVRVAVPLSEMGECLRRLPGAVVARAANGVCYAHLPDAAAATPALAAGSAVIEYGPSSVREGLQYWPQTDSGFPLMKRIKEMFDPQHLLNRGRFYGRF